GEGADGVRRPGQAPAGAGLSHMRLCRPRRKSAVIGAEYGQASARVKSMTSRLLFLAAGLAILSGPALAADAPADSAPVSTAYRTSDQKTAAWRAAKAPAEVAPDDGRNEPLPDRDTTKPDRKIHGEIGAGVGTGGYRSAYGVATISIGKSSSATVAVST